MNRNHRKETKTPIAYQDQLRKTAFHEAGHATSIYLYSQSYSLPNVFFQITTKELCNNKLFVDRSNPSTANHRISKIKGDQLIQSLASSLLESRSSFKAMEQQAFQTAYETDIINLLVGPLVEAKYVALRDNENFNPLLINTNALKYYGGISDLDCVYDYLYHFIPNKHEREQKLVELFEKAFLFVNDPANWKAIASLASYILNNKNKNITCDEAFTVLDKSVTLLTTAINKPTLQ
jgi:hypothetical protein